MPYAVKANGSFRAIDETTIVESDETYYEDVPQWAYDVQAAAVELAAQELTEDAWRLSELAFIANQLTAIEDEDPSALPGTASQWRAYRIKVRAWAEGAENYPDIEQRPTRPE